MEGTINLMKKVLFAVAVRRVRAALVSPVLLVAVLLLACGTATEPMRVEVTREVPVEVTRIVPVRVEIIREVPVEVTQLVPKEVEVIREVPVEVIREVLVEVTREAPIEVVQEVTLEVTRIVPKEVAIVKEVIVTATPSHRPTARPTAAPPRPTRTPTPIPTATPRPSVSVGSNVAPSGGRLTIIGEGFEPFAPVDYLTIGDLDLPMNR